MDRTNERSNSTHASWALGQSMGAYGLVILQLREDKPFLASGKGALDHAMETSLSMLGRNILRERSSPLASSPERRDGATGLGQTLGLGHGRHVAALHLLGGDHGHEGAIEDLRGEKGQPTLRAIAPDVPNRRRLRLAQAIATIEMSRLARRGGLVQHPKADVAKQAGINLLLVLVLEGENRRIEPHFLGWMMWGIAAG